MRRILFTICFLMAFSFMALAGDPVKEFVLATTSSACPLLYDAADASVVGKAAEMLSEDVALVCGKKLPVVTSPTGCRSMVIIGSLESAYIKQLTSSGKISTEALEGKWETYQMTLVEKPFKGVSKALVIAGSDARGAAYGAMDISSSLGVSPWVWWCDVPVTVRSKAVVNVTGVPSREPSVKYRGIFINDEDFGLDIWAGKTYEPECAPIGPKTYARICELLLRMKANHLLPAMHIGSVAFYSNPENKKVAGEYGIVIGTSHCEPLGYNNFVEWDKKVNGEWSYRNNKEGINSVLEARVRDCMDYENVYTVALRGVHDYPMDFTSTHDQKTAMLQEAIADQRNILEKYLGRPASEIPQAFTPYKEVLNQYDNGLVLPDDMTIIWPDDNYGYIKRLSNAAEQRRSGRSGVYYHVSYQGQPHSYTWFSSTSTTLMYEELKKAYRSTADRIWILNCGDIKGCEMQTEFFLDMAFDFESFDYDKAASYPTDWVTAMFGEQYRDELAMVMNDFLRLCWSRRPELMGWGLRKNIDTKTREILTDTEFSFVNYNEAQTRIDNWKKIGSVAERLLNEMPAQKMPAFYETVYYYVKGAELMNRKHLLAQLYRQYVREGRASADAVRKEVVACHDSLDVITKGYWSLLDGKWHSIISPVQDWPNMLSFYEMPDVSSQVTLSAVPSFGVCAEGEGSASASAWHVMEGFSAYEKGREHWMEIYNKSEVVLDWKAYSDQPWVRLSSDCGSLSSEGYEAQQKINVSIDWNSVPEGERIGATIFLECAGRKEAVLVSVFNPGITVPEGVYVEKNGYVSIPGAGFHRKQEAEGKQVRVLDGIGVEGKVAMLGEGGDPLECFRSREGTLVEYDFWSFGCGMVDVYTYMVPSFPINSDRDFQMNNLDNWGCRYSVCIDDRYYYSPYTSDVEFNQYWYDAVQSNMRVNKSTIWVSEPGLHNLKLICGDPGTMVQKIVIDFGGMKHSYLGPATK